MNKWKISLEPSSSSRKKYIMKIKHYMILHIYNIVFIITVILIQYWIIKNDRHQNIPIVCVHLCSLTTVISIIYSSLIEYSYIYLYILWTTISQHLIYICIYILCVYISIWLWYNVCVCGVHEKLISNFSKHSTHPHLSAIIIMI